MLFTFEYMWYGRLGQVSPARHQITLIVEAKPVYELPRRSVPHARDFERKKVQRMPKKGFIQPFNSKWASLVVVAKKRDAFLRLSMDYRRFDEVTIRDPYPMPRTDECIDSLGDAAVFTTLAATCG